MRTAAATLRLFPRAIAVLPRVASVPTRWRRRLLFAALVMLALGSLYMLWLRDSPFVSVEKVTVTGLTTAEAPRIREALEMAARQQTTLHVDEDALRQAVADEPLVRDVRAVPDFPHGLRIEVVENRPVAVLSSGGKSTVAVAADGTVLEGVKLERGLPSLKVGSLPSGPRVGDGPTRDLVAVAAAAPEPLLARASSISVRRGPGVVVELRHGPELWFGSAVELDEKWAAASSVLADRSSQGATYVDLRLADRPVAGGLGMDEELQPGAEAAGPGATDPLAPTTTEPTAPDGTTAAPATTDPAAAGAPDPSLAEPAPATTAPTAPPATTAPADPSVPAP